MSIAAEGAIIGGKLRLVRPLASGAMGAVWIARHQLLDTDVAVKFMEGSIAENEAARQRFEREAKAAALIKSPHVVQILDYGIEGTTPYIVMELLEGEDLDGRLTRTGPLSLEEAYRIVEPLGKALRRAHDLGIVHRDLKPGNVFLARSGDDEILKILDFGIAKDVSLTGAATATSTGMMLGSPSYMSPEQIRDTKQVDQRSDLWAVGVILYEVLTGRVPFDESENIGKLLVSICTDPFPPPSTHMPALSKSVDAFFEKALARDKNARFQSMAELVEAFGVVAGVRPAQRSVPIGDGLARTGSGIDRSGTLGTDVTIALDQGVSGKSDAALPAPRPSDVRSTLSPAERGSVAGSPRKRLVPIVLAGVVGIGAIGAVVMARTRSPSDTPVASAPTDQGAANGPGQTKTPSVAPGEALRTARVTIEPADASVEVDGRVVPVERDGTVSVSGALGSMHAVRVYKDGREIRGDVALVEGGAMPAKLALAGSAAAEPTTKPATNPVIAKDKPDPVTTATTATTTTATPKATTTSKDPGPKPPGTDPQPVRDFQ